MYTHTHRGDAGGVTGGIKRLKVPGLLQYIYLCCVVRREMQWHCEVSVLLLFFVVVFNLLY